MTPAGILQLQQDEGCKLVAYPDPASGAEPWTLGFGHAVGIAQGQTCTMDEAVAWLRHDIANVEQILTLALPWFADCHPVRRDVLTNIAFNIGAHGLLKWTTTLGHFAAANWQAAHDDILTEGRWDTQVGGRAKRLAAATLSGVWA